MCAIIVFILQLPSSYYLRQRNKCNALSWSIQTYLNLFIQFITYLPVNNTLSSKDSNKIFFVANYCFPSHLIKQEPKKKQQRDTLWAIV